MTSDTLVYRNSIAATTYQELVSCAVLGDVERVSEFAENLRQERRGEAEPMFYNAKKGSIALDEDDYMEIDEAALERFIEDTTLEATRIKAIKDEFEDRILRKMYDDFSKEHGMNLPEFNLETIDHYNPDNTGSKRDAEFWGKVRAARHEVKNELFYELAKPYIEQNKARWHDAWLGYRWHDDYALIDPYTDENTADNSKALNMVDVAYHRQEYYINRAIAEQYFLERLEDRQVEMFNQGRGDQQLWTEVTAKRTPRIIE